jgi:microcystin-dependent protein
MGVEMEKVKAADKIVRPVPIEAYPMAAGQVYTGEEGGEIGDVTWRAVQETPTGTLPCDGTARSRSTYSDLFSKIGVTYGAGDGSSTFNVPNLQRRVMVGVGGSGTSTLASSMGANGGSETHTLTTAQLASHRHSITHTHDIAHTHNFTSFSNPGAGALGPGAQTATASTNSDSRTNTTAGSNTANSGASSDSDSGFQGGGDPHNNVQPSLVLAPYIRFRLGPTDTIQTLPISWGGVNAQWRLDTLKNFPVTSHDNLHTVLVTGDRPGAVVRITATSGAQSGNSSENKIIGVLALPHSFTKWKTDAFKIATKVNMTGCAAATSATITLRISDPTVAGAYLANTYTRTVNVSAGTIADAAYVDAKLTAEDFGRDWRPGYMVRFELLWSIPKTFTSATLDVGFMEVGWR